MARCMICDYSDGHANDYLHRPASSNRVRFNVKTREFLCDECVHIVQNSVYSQADEKGETDYDTNAFLFRTDSYSDRELADVEVASDRSPVPVREE